jgi:uncharacterized damage-inducible protein DinB
MHAEIETYARELRWILEQLVDALSGLSAAQLNWRPSTGSANSVYAIVGHVVASTRVYALGFGCGRPVVRNRAEEFTGSGNDGGELVAAIRRLSGELDDALATLAPDALDRRGRPRQDLWGTGVPREISGRDALVESIRHAALHLGELRLTRDLALRPAPG